MAKLPNFCPIVRASRLEKAFVLSSFDNKLPAEAFDDARVTYHNGSKKCIKSPFQLLFTNNLMRNFPHFLASKQYKSSYEIVGSKAKFFRVSNSDRIILHDFRHDSAHKQDNY